MLRDEIGLYSNFFLGFGNLVSAGLGIYTLLDNSYNKHVEANLTLLLFVIIFATILINLLIAMINNTFGKIQKDAVIFYKYMFAGLVIDHQENRFSPPFNIIYFFLLSFLSLFKEILRNYYRMTTRRKFLAFIMQMILKTKKKITSLQYSKTFIMNLSNL